MTTGQHPPPSGPAVELGDEATQNMQDLLDDEIVGHPQLRRGDIIEGVVVGNDRDGILVDIGAKSEGVIPPQEMHSLRSAGSQSIKSGDKVLVYVMQPETHEGQIIVSLDRARGEKGWRLLQQYYEQATSFEGQVTDFNKGGLLVDLEGVHAFVPLSQLVGGRVDRPSDESGEKGLAAWVGKTLRVKVIEINRRRNRVILSERAAMQEWRAQQKDRLLLELHEGDIRRGRITSIRDFGIFVDLGGADGLVHLSELSWDRVKSPEEMYQAGDEVDVFILKIDHETKKIGLSLRRAQPEQWEGLIDKYQPGQIVIGQVTKLAPFGAFARIEGPLEGLIHISELVDRRVTHPKEVVNEGDVLPLKIVRIERDRHRLGLSLKQARPQAEEMGYVFDESGSILASPGQPVVQPPPEEAAVAASDEPLAEVAEEPLPAVAEEPPAEVGEPPLTELGDQLPPEVRAALEAEVAEEPLAEVAEEPAAAVVEEPLAEMAEELPAAVAEEPAAAVAEEPPAEMAEELPAEVAEEPAAAVVEEPAAAVVEEPPAEMAEEPLAEVAEEPAAAVAEVVEEPPAAVAEVAEEPEPEAAPEPTTESSEKAPEAAAPRRGRKSVSQAKAVEEE